MANSLVSMSCPGTKIPLRENKALEPVLRLLKEHGIAHEFVDSMLGWGCLNQDWVEFTCEMEMSWGWCKPEFLTEQEWVEVLYPLLVNGQVLMQVYYKKGDGELVAHH